MARFARISVPKRPYLIAHAGHEGGDVFYSTKDRRDYLALLAVNAAKFKMEVWAYCLLPDRVCLLVYPKTANSMARAIAAIHLTHAARINARNMKTGRFWDGRFHSSLLDTPHLMKAARYVECLSVRCGLARQPEKFPWSSARAHSLGKTDPLLSSNSPLPDAKKVGDWTAWLNQEPDEAMEETFRSKLSTGRPCVTPAMLKRLEITLGIPLVLKKPGRKPKK